MGQVAGPAAAFRAARLQAALRAALQQVARRQAALQEAALREGAAARNNDIIHRGALTAAATRTKTLHGYSACDPPLAP
jgi:hypothetical protein